MDTSFERAKNTSDEWYTPKRILDSLGEFDLDPCAPPSPLWPTAKVMYNKYDDGLRKEWFGRVWLNPPYSRPLVGEFMKKMARHGRGTALLFSRCDTGLFHDIIFKKATSVLFIRGRLRFYRPDGTQGDSSGCGSVLIAFGDEDSRILENCTIEGKFLNL